MDSDNDTPRRTGFQTVLSSPLFWALLVGGLIGLVLILGPGLRERYTVL